MAGNRKDRRAAERRLKKANEKIANKAAATHRASQSQGKPEPSSWVVWLRGVGGSGTFFGLFGVMQEPRYFWWSVCFFYGGLFVLCIDLHIERLSLRVKQVVYAVLAVSVLVYAWKFVLVRPPLTADAMLINIEYPSGTIIGGKKWRSEYTEVDVKLDNPSSDPCEDLNIVIKLDEQVAFVAQTSDVADVSIEDAMGSNFKLGDLIQGVHGKSMKEIGVHVLSTNTGFRIRCGRLAPKTSIKLVMAAVRLPSRDNTGGGNGSTQTTLTLGSLDEAKLGPRPTPKSISVVGDYIAEHRWRSIAIERHLQDFLNP